MGLHNQASMCLSRPLRRSTPKGSVFMRSRSLPEFGGGGPSVLAHLKYPFPVLIQVTVQRNKMQTLPRPRLGRAVRGGFSRWKEG